MDKQRRQEDMDTGKTEKKVESQENRQTDSYADTWSKKKNRERQKKGMKEEQGEGETRRNRKEKLTLSSKCELDSKGV